MAEAPPKVVVLAGPNGAGKSTSAARLLRGALKVEEFVNADTIAQGLSAFAQERVAFQAGRIMLERLSELASIRASFGFETTLASRSYAPRLKKLKADGYEVHLLFLWLASADLAIARVAERVCLGGHDVPEETIRRRYTTGLLNLRTTYLPLADSWQVVDNTNVDSPLTIAAGSKRVTREVYEQQCWNRIMEMKGEP